MAKGNVLGNIQQPERLIMANNDNSSDGKGKIIQTALEPAAKEFAEGSKGAGKDLGEAVALTAKSVKALLSPLKLFVWGYEQIEELFIPEVERKLKGVPAYRRIEPNLLIAGPTVEALRFAGEQPELRDMFATLLATAIDAETAKFAHPTFVGIIKQLSPDEARILKYLKSAHSVPLIKVRSMSKDKRQENTIQGQPNIFCFLGTEADLQYADMVIVYIDNICRLGLCEILAKYQLAGDNVYELLENTPEIKDLLDQINSREGREGKIDRQVLRLTEFGYRFANACISGGEALVSL